MNNCTCGKEIDGTPLIGGYARCKVHSPNNIFRGDDKLVITPISEIEFRQFLNGKFSEEKIEEMVKKHINAQKKD